MDLELKDENALNLFSDSFRGSPQSLEESSLSEKEDQVCAICSDKYCNPRVLACLHVFCERCLNKRLRDEASDSGKTDTIIKCPICAQETKVLGIGAGILPCDYVLANLIDMSAIDSMEVVCTSCKAKEKAVARCCDCANFLCPNCNSAHQYMRCFENHNVLSFEELKSSHEAIPIHKPIYCETHPTETMKSYCVTCQVPICNDCLLSNHKVPDHQFQRLAEAEEQQRKELSNLLTESKAKLEFCDEASNQLQNSLGELQIQHDSAQQLIQETFQSYKAILEKARDKALEDLENLHSDRELKVMESCHNMEKTVEKINDACKFTSRLLDHSNTIEILLLNKIVKAQLLNLINNTPKPDVSTNFDFDTDIEKFESAVKATFGHFRSENVSSPKESSPTLPSTGQLTTTSSGSPVSLISSFDGDLTSSIPSIPPGFSLHTGLLSTEVSVASSLPATLPSPLPSTLQGLTSIQEYNLQQLASLAEKDVSSVVPAPSPDPSPTPSFTLADLFSGDLSSASNAINNLQALAKLGSVSLNTQVGQNKNERHETKAQAKTQVTGRDGICTERGRRLDHSGSRELITVQYDDDDYLVGQIVVNTKPTTSLVDALSPSGSAGISDHTSVLGTSSQVLGALLSDLANNVLNGGPETNGDANGIGLLGRGSPALSINTTIASLNGGSYQPLSGTPSPIVSQTDACEVNVNLMPAKIANTELATCSKQSNQNKTLSTSSNNKSGSCKSGFRPNMKQQTLQAVFERKETFSSTHPKAMQITDDIAYMIAVDCQPFSIVENKGFRRLINHVEPRYVIPGRKYFSTVVIPSLYLKTKTKVTSMLQKAEDINLTTDMWTSSAGDDYLSLTSHFLTDDFHKFSHVSLDVVPFCYENHSAENILQFVLNTLAEWNMSEKINVVVRDNARNITSALNQGNLNHIPCLAHSLQLIIKDGCLNHKQVSNLTAICRQVVGHFKHSVKANKVLQRCQKALGVAEHRLTQDKPTRWNSTYEMLSRLHEQRQAIALAAQELTISAEISAAQWNLIEELLDVLKIFLDATNVVSTSNTSVSETIPIINGINTALKKRKPGGSSFQGMKNDMLASIKLRYGDCEKNSVYAIASLLDPRFKNRIFSNQENVTSAKNQILEMVNDSEELANLVEETTNATSKSTLWSLYAEVMEKNKHTASNLQSANSELQAYLDEPVLSPEGDIFSYWRNSKFLKLRKIAKKYLAVPPASVFSERLFSTAGVICDQKRSRLTPEKVRMLVFLNKNLE